MSAGPKIRLKRKLPEVSAEDPEEETNGSIPGFLFKVYEMLMDASNNKIVSWGESGSIIVIKNPIEFSEKILPKYFKHRNFSSFVRQLNMYDFHKTKYGSYSTCFEHPLFKKGTKHLLSSIKRKVAGKTENIQPERKSGTLEKISENLERISQRLSSLEKRQSSYNVLISECQKAKESTKYTEMMCKLIAQMLGGPNGKSSAGQFGHQRGKRKIDNGRPYIEGNMKALGWDVPRLDGTALPSSNSSNHILQSPLGNMGRETPIRLQENCTENQSPIKAIDADDNDILLKRNPSLGISSGLPSPLRMPLSPYLAYSPYSGQTIPKDPLPEVDDLSPLRINDSGIREERLSNPPSDLISSNPPPEIQQISLVHPLIQIPSSDAQNIKTSLTEEQRAAAQQEAYIQSQLEQKKT